MCFKSSCAEAIFYGDACPIIANNESIRFDDFEMDQTSVRRTTQCYVSSRILLVASHAYICTQMCVSVYAFHCVRSLHNLRFVANHPMSHPGQTSMVVWFGGRTTP